MQQLQKVIIEVKSRHVTKCQCLHTEGIYIFSLVQKGDLQRFWNRRVLGPMIRNYPATFLN